MPLDKAISERAQGKYPLSLSTSLAFEALTDTHRNKVKNFDSLFINLSTLVRNIYTSLDTDSQMQLGDAELTNTAIDEIEQIDSIIRDTFKNLSLVYYVNNTQSLQKAYPNAKLRVEKTPKQIFYKTLLDNTYSNIHDYYHESNKIKSFKVVIKYPIPERAIMFTHSLVDLVSYPHFKDLLLLESYTGELKDKTQWYTKFKSEASLQIPIIYPMLAIFGDAECFFAQGKALREAVLATADTYHWSSVTTFERIKLTLGFMKDQATKDLLLKFIHQLNVL